MASTPTTEAPPARKELTPYERFHQYVSSPRFKHELIPLLGSEPKVDRFVRVTLTATQANPDLLLANRRTLLLACMKAAGDGLMPDGKEAVFNVYNTKVKKKNDAGNPVETWEPHVQYLPMVGGIVKKMYALRDWDGEPLVLRVSAYVVHARDHIAPFKFKYQLGDDPKIEHEPYTGDEDPGEITHAYASIKLRNGETIRIVMTRREIEATRLQSKAPDSLMWSKFYDQGCRKAVLKRAAKDMPSSQELDRVIAHDNEATGLEFGPGLTDMMDESANPSVVALPDQRDEQKSREIPTTAAGKPVDPALAQAKANRSKKAERVEKAVELPLEGTATGLPSAADLDKDLDAQTSIDGLDLVADEIRTSNFPDDVAKPLWAKYNARKSEMGGGQ